MAVLFALYLNLMSYEDRSLVEVRDVALDENLVRQSAPDIVAEPVEPSQLSVPKVSDTVSEMHQSVAPIESLQPETIVNAISPPSEVTEVHAVDPPPPQQQPQEQQQQEQQKDQSIAQVREPKDVGPVQLLSIDFHISPIADLKDVFGKFLKQTVVHDFSLSGACGQKGTCSNGRIQIKEDLSTLYLTHEAKVEFYNAYRGENSLIRGMDAMVCSHPSGMCELIMPFNKSVILWVTTRFEQGREGNREKMQGLIGNFRALAKRPDTAILANNMYDVHYFNYFTGLNPTYIPSFCDYTGAKYSWNGQNNIILMHGYRPKRNILPSSTFIADIRRLAPRFKFEFVRDVYPGHYAYEQLAGHPAMLHIPYQASIMSFFEHYRMCIPLIAPSLDLLTSWHMRYRIVSERTWDMALHDRETSASVLPRHPEASPRHVFDPNDEHNADGVRYWLQFSDFYTFPHVILFDSWEDLAQKLAVADFGSISRAMCAHNQAELGRIAAQWSEVLARVPPSAERPRLSPDVSYDDAMNAIYGPGQWFAY